MVYSARGVRPEWGLRAVYLAGQQWKAKLLWSRLDWTRTRIHTSHYSSPTYTDLVVLVFLCLTLRKPHCVFGFLFLNVTTQVRSHRFQFPIVAHQAAVGAASSQLTPPRRGSRFRLR